MQCFNDCQLKSYNSQSEFAELQVPCQWSFLAVFLFVPKGKVDAMNCSSIIHPSPAQMEQVKALVTALIVVKANCQSFCFYSFFFCFYSLLLFLQFFSSLTPSLQSSKTFMVESVLILGRNSIARAGSAMLLSPSRVHF